MTCISEKYRQSQEIYSVLLAQADSYLPTSSQIEKAATECVGVVFIQRIMDLYKHIFRTSVSEKKKRNVLWLFNMIKGRFILTNLVNNHAAALNFSSDILLSLCGGRILIYL